MTKNWQIRCVLFQKVWLLPSSFQFFHYTTILERVTWNKRQYFINKTHLRLKVKKVLSKIKASYPRQFSKYYCRSENFHFFSHRFFDLQILTLHFICPPEMHGVTEVTMTFTVIKGTENLWNSTTSGTDRNAYWGINVTMLSFFVGGIKW